MGWLLELREFDDLIIGKGFQHAHGWVWQVLYLFASDLPLKKSSAQKIFGSNLYLKNRRIEFKPIPPYAELRSACENFPEKELCLVLVCLYRFVRTYFKNKMD